MKLGPYILICKAIGTVNSGKDYDGIWIRVPLPRSIFGQKGLGDLMVDVAIERPRVPWLVVHGEFDIHKSTED